jgi:DNA-binding GntR family transcriptional regulator
MPLPEQVNKFKRPLARQEVYATLQKWIVEGVYKPGENMRDQELAEALGVSRTPVREALQRLEDEGFVQTSANRWTRVAQIDGSMADNLYPIIGALECLALSLAQDHLSSADLQAMSDANESLRQAIAANDTSAAYQADDAFHQVFIQQSGNSDLIRMLSESKLKLRWLEMLHFTDHALATTSLHEHESIIAALHSKQYDRALEALKSNWD